MNKIMKSVIIPTYNHCDDLLKPCIESIIKYTDLADTEIIVVANGCTDNTQEYLADKPVRVVWFDKGLGYTKATNEGIKVARGKYIILLNNDTVLLYQPKNQWLEMLINPFEDPKVGMTGPMKTNCPSANRDFLIFFCVCIKREMFDKFGLLDEEFSPGYGEDTDFCCKIEDGGYKVVQICPSDKYYADKRMVGGFPIFHKGNETFRNWEGGEELIKKNNKILADRYVKEKDVPNIEKALKCDGYMSNDELIWLGKEAKKRKTIVEVGSWHGRSTRALGDNACGIVYAIDHFDGSQAERDTSHASAKWENGDHAFMEFCTNNLDLIQQGKIIPLRGTSISMAKLLRANGVRAEMIFIDGGHTYEEVKQDIECWGDLLTDDGIFCGHDMGAWAGVEQAVKEKIKLFYVGKGTTIWFCGKGDIGTKSSIYDCFIFNDELDILDTRFAGLYNVVDRFVIVEGTRNFANHLKPLHFQNNLQRFSKYLSKVSHVIVDDYPTTHPMGMENHQRDCIVRGLGDCRDKDIIIMSDCDEIPSVEAIRNYRVEDGVMSLEMDLYYYNMQTKMVDKWRHARILPFSLFKQVGPSKIRYAMEIGLNPGVIPNGGKHLSYFGGVEKIIKKLEDFSHQEYNRDEFKNTERIRQSIEQGKDLFGRDSIRFEKKTQQ